jgi:toxin ParE1/3/4
MVQIVWTNRARKDLRQITEYISRDSATYAKNQVNRIFKKAEILIQLPLAGKVVEELNDRTIREIIEGNYRIIYRILNIDQIDILAVHHGARSLKKRKIK